MVGIRIQFVPLDIVKVGCFWPQVEMISLLKFGILIHGVVFIPCKQIC